MSSSADNQISEADLLEVFTRDGLYTELRKIASGYMAHERGEHTLQPTALVNEAWLRLVADRGLKPESKQEFCAAAANMMRRILIDHARKKLARKRGGGLLQLTVAPNDLPDKTVNLDIIALDDALTRLAELNERHARVVELRFFGGLTIEETAAVLDTSDFTVKADWRVARAWLLSELQVPD